MEMWLVYSHKHEAWWGIKGWGYTTRIEMAGRFSREEATAIVERSMDGWRPQEDGTDALPHTVMVLANSRNMISAVAAVTVAMVQERARDEA